MLQIDVWYNGPRGAEAFAEGIKTITAGKKIMRSFHSQGKEEVRMYVRDSSGDASNNRYYYFNGDKIKFDQDDY